MFAGNVPVSRSGTKSGNLSGNIFKVQMEKLE
jgi:hypothetical protein